MSGLAFDTLVVSVPQGTSLTDYAMAAFAFVSALGAIAASVVAFVTYISSTAPNVLVYLMENALAHTVRLEIKNFGNGVAYDVSIKIEDELFISSELRAEADALIEHGIPMLAPGASRSTVLGRSFEMKEHMGAASVRATVQCYRRKNGPRRCIKNVCVLDVRSFLNTVTEFTPEEVTVKVLESLNSSVSISRRW